MKKIFNNDGYLTGFEIKETMTKKECKNLFGDYEEVLDLKKNEFQCAKCKQIHKNTWSEEEQEKEMLELWGDLPEEERAVVCDDCFHEIHPKKNLELARRFGYKK